MGLPIAGSYHTELSAYAGLRSGDDGLAAAVELALGRLLRRLRRGALALARLRRAAARARHRPERIGRWDRGVDVDRFSPALRTRAADGRIRVLVRRPSDEGEGRRPARRRVPRRRGRATRAWSSCSPAAAPRRTRCAPGWARRRTFLGWLEGDALARAYADADLFLFCSQTDTFGQVVLEAQASGLPVVAVAAGGPSELIASGRTGILCPPRTSALADAVAGLAASPRARARLASGGMAAVRDRTWEASLAALGAGWTRALATRAATAHAVRAA